MKILKKIINMCIVLGVTFLSMVSPVSAASDSRFQTYTDGESIWIFIDNYQDEINQVTAQIGNSAVADVQLKRINEVEGVKTHTIILFDNSFSITEKNREKMKNIVKELIHNHDENEFYTLATFDTEIHELAVESANYEELLLAVDNIQYMNQDTYLKNILYKVFSEDKNVEKTYKRYVVLSDGADDNEVGYTYNEIVTLLKDKSYPIYTIGSKFSGRVDELEEMFSMSRAADSEYYLLDELDGISQITRTIKQDNAKVVACVNIPEEMRDGSEKNIQLVVQHNGMENVYNAKVNMPFGTVIETEVIEVQEVEPVAEVEIVEEKSGKGGIFIVLIPIVIIAAFVVAIVLIKNKKKDDVKEENFPLYDEDDDDSTILMRDDNDSTVLMDVEVEDSTILMKKSKTVILSPEDGYSKSLKAMCDGQVSIGRKKECTIQITDDKSVSGIHCIIYSDYRGELVIKDNNSSNGTFLNDQRLTSESRLESGDSLKIGRTLYWVKVIEE